MMISGYGAYADLTGFGNLGGTCPAAYARLDNCGNVPSGGGLQFTIAATRYNDTIRWHNEGNTSRRDAALREADAAAERTSGAPREWLRNARNGVMRVLGIRQTDASIQETLRAREAAAQAQIRYRDYSTVAPDWTRTAELAAEQTVADVGALVTGQGWRPSGVGPLGQRRTETRVPGQCDAFDVVCKLGKWWEEERWKVLLGIGGIVITIVAVYALASGVGKGLVT